MSSKISYKGGLILNFKVFDEKSNRNIEITIKQEYEGLVPPLPDKDYQESKSQ